VTRATIASPTSPTPPWHGRTLADLLLGIAVAAGTAVAIAALWLRPGQAWLNPELLRVGEVVTRLPTFSAKLALFFDWRVFDTNPHRARQISDLLEILDASVRPYLANVIVHPVLGVTTCLFVVLSLTFAYQLFRTNRFSRGEALLFCALVAATPGFMSNLFVYIRPAKPISFAVMAAFLLCVFRFAADPRYSRLPLLYLVLVVGVFTDELLMWATVFVAIAVFLLGAHRQSVPAGAMGVAAMATWALAVFLVLPLIYGAFAPEGARTVSFSDVETGDPVARRMLGYLAMKWLYTQGIDVAARTIAACFGLYENNTVVFYLGRGILIAILILLVVFVRRRDTPAWKLAAVGLFGLYTFSTFGTWIHWYHGPGTLKDHVVLNYYYNSPVSLFVVLLAAAVFKSLQALVSIKAPQRAWPATVAAAVVIVAVVANNLPRFAQLNDVERMFQLGPTDVETIYRTMNQPRSGDAPPTVIVTGGADRLEAMLERYHALGRKLFGAGWETSQLNRERSVFEQNMPQFSSTYAYFGYHYGIRLCILHFLDDGPCPVTFRETPDAAERGRLPFAVADK
jgi:hypothetical protein